MSKLYIVSLEGKRIGTTLFEAGDPAMGVVIGNLRLEGIPSGYAFFRAYCLKNNIPLEPDEPEDLALNTYAIEAMHVKTEDGVRIQGEGTHVYGMDADGFKVSVFGISHPFYSEEFPHHCKAYDERFKDYR